MKFFRVVAEDYSGPDTYKTYEKFFINKSNALEALEKVFKKELESKKEYGFEFEVLEDKEERKSIKDEWGDVSVIVLEELQTED